MHSCPHCACLLRAQSAQCPHCDASLLNHPLSRTAAAILMGLSLSACPGPSVAKYGAPPSDDTASVAPEEAAPAPKGDAS